MEHLSAGLSRAHAKGQFFNPMNSVEVYIYIQGISFFYPLRLQHHFLSPAMNRIALPRWYTTPTTQVILVGITCFGTVGMFSALTNLGAGGQQDVSLSDSSNAVLYGLFSLTGFVSGGICNVLGPPTTLFIGTLGYALYTGALWW